MLISFECKSCHSEFDSDVGKITFTPDPVFTIPPLCPRCGPRKNDQVFLTEVGQSQLTDAYMNS
jgi:NAD-dependent SIR2 family protein deacetylase